MARKKKSKSQVNKEAYEKYKLALEYYDIKLKLLKKPTAKSVANAKTLWLEQSRIAKGQGIIGVPSVAQAAKYIRENPLEENTVNVKDTLPSFEMQEFIDNLTKPHVGMEGMERATYNEVRKHHEAQDRLRNKFAWARQKIGDYELSQALKQSDFMGRIEAYIYSSHYLYEETEAIDNEIIPLFDSLVETIMADL